MNTKTFLGNLFLVTTFLIGCNTSNSIEDTISDSFIVNNDSLALQTSRQINSNRIILVDTTRLTNFKGSKTSTVEFLLTQVSELSSPIIDGSPVQATMIENDLFTSVISYNRQGSQYLGAVDVATLNFSGTNIGLRSNIQFIDADVNAVTTDGFKLYTALSTNNETIINDGNRSAGRSFTYFLGYAIENSSSRIVSLPSFAANSVTTDSDWVYFTSGNTGGLTVYDKNLSTMESYIELEDARWVDTNEEHIIVLLGDNDGDGNGSLILLDKDDFSLVDEFTFPGANTPEAKNSVEVRDHLAFIAAGRSGVHIMDLTDGSILETIPVPDHTELGLSEDVVTTNAVSVDRDKMFISNGEAGVYVAELSKSIRSVNPGENLSASIVGQLQLGNVQSVNHLSYRNGLLLVAAGIGGVKTIKLTLIDDD